MIQDLFLVNSVNALERIPVGSDTRFVILDPDARLEGVVRHARQKGLTEIPVEDILSLVPSDAADDFIKSMVAVGRPEELLWWAHPVSRRLAIRDTLFESIYLALALDAYCHGADQGKLVVITNRWEIGAQAVLLAREAGYRAQNLVAREGIVRRLVRCYPCVLAVSLLRLFVNKIWCCVCLPGFRRQNIAPVVVMSNFNKHSLAKGAGRFEDIYWGRISEKVLDGTIKASFLLAVDVPLKKALEMLRAAGTPPYFPKEVVLSWMDLFRVAVRSLGILSPGLLSRGNFVVQGRNFSFLLNHFWSKGIRSRAVIDVVAMYYAMARIGREVQPRKFLFLFENKAIERAAILALRKFSPGTLIAGYQHAALKPKDIHMSARFAETEKKVWPDTILTTGSAASTFLERAFGWDKEKLKETCALRRVSHNEVVKPRPPGCRRLLVILSTDISEYGAMLRMLNGAAKDLAGMDVILRPHPDISLEQALALTGPLDFSYRVEQVAKPLPQTLNEADALIYASSTVAIEALLHGVPLIRLKYAGVLDSDTLSELKVFKWEARRPGEIRQQIEAIWQMPLEDFRRQQEEAAGYARNYWRAAEDRQLEIFLH